MVLYETTAVGDLYMKSIQRLPLLLLTLTLLSLSIIPNVRAEERTMWGASPTTCPYQDGDEAFTLTRRYFYIAITKNGVNPGDAYATPIKSTWEVFAEYETLEDALKDYNKISKHKRPFDDRPHVLLAPPEAEHRQNTLLELKSHFRSSR